MSSASPSASPPPSCHNDVDSSFGANPLSYEVRSVLGQCCDDVGQVYLAFHVPTDTPVALKKFNMDKAKDELENIQVHDHLIVGAFCYEIIP